MKSNTEEGNLSQGSAGTLCSHRVGGVVVLQQFGTQCVGNNWFLDEEAVKLRLPWIIQARPSSGNTFAGELSLTHENALGI